MVTTQAPWRQVWKDYYHALGLSSDASPDQIKRAYRDRVFILHPDRLQDAPEGARRTAEEEFKRLNAAYEVLSNSVLRNEYDKEYRLRSKSGNSTAEQGTPLASITLEPNEISLSVDAPGEAARFSFTVQAVGLDDPGGVLRIQADQLWVSISRLSAESIEDASSFPLRVTIEIDTFELGPGQTYKAGLYAFVEDTAARLELSLRVGSSSSWGAPAEAGDAQDDEPLVTSETSKSFWFFEWLSVPWRLTFALTSGTLTPAFLYLWVVVELDALDPLTGTEAAAVVSAATGVVLTTAACLYASAWLRAVGSTPWYLGILCSTLVFTGMVIAGALAALAVLFVLAAIAAVVLTILVLWAGFAMLGALLDS